MSPLSFHLLIFCQFVEDHICRLLDASEFLVGNFEEAAFFHHTIWRVTIRTDVDLFAHLDYLLPQGFLAQIGQLFGTDPLPDTTFFILVTEYFITRWLYDLCTKKRFK